MGEDTPADSASPWPAGRVLVIGSINLDTVLSVDRLPEPGETVIAHGLREALGGKGQSQAIAAARFGSATRLAGAVGSDSAGDLARQELAAAGVDISLVRLSSRPTGRAVVCVDSSAENSIVVSRGANEDLQALRDVDREAILSADVVLTQLEAGTDVAFEAILFAHENGIRVVLNAAPASAIPERILRCVDFFIVNRVEILEFGATSDIDQCAAALAEIVGHVLVTLGSEGGRLYRKNEPVLRLQGLTIEPVDTTGSGDAVCGVFAAALAQSLAAPDAFQRALVAGSLAALGHGNAPSIPTREVIDAAVRRRGEPSLFRPS
jgi:ribokinase